jgi:putative tryptophan/tyrosine transport system substrate-binding protein
VIPDPVNVTYRGAIIQVASRRQLPAIYPFRNMAVEGGLISYGVSIIDLYRRSAAYVDRILKGTSVGELPIQAPSKFELVLNLKTARTLGLTLPPTLLARADEVIE